MFANASSYSLRSSHKTTQVEESVMCVWRRGSFAGLAPGQNVNSNVVNEQSIASARASVMIYDESNKKWVPSGSSSGLSKVHIYQHVVNNTFRVVGRKLHDQEVVINCSILKGLKYNQATPTFHQWRDNRQVYGLNFSSKDDAEAFAFAMMHAVEALNSSVPIGPPRVQHNINNTAGPPPGPPQNNNHHAPPNSHNHHHSEEDMGYRTMTREDIAIIQERRMSQPQQQVVLPSLSSPNTPVVVQNSAPPGHHRTNSAPQPPPPPPAPAMPAGGGPPPPPPPPMPNGPLSRSGDAEVGSLAAALASAHLRKANRPQPDAISTTSTSSSSSSGSTSSGSLYGTLRGNRAMTNGTNGDSAGPGGSTSLMDEMAKTLARRRAMVKENSAPNVPALQSNNSNSNLHSNSQDDDDKPTAGKMKEAPSSPKNNQRKRTGSDTSSGIVVNGNGASYDNDLDALKQDILKEVRKELYKIKAEIIDAIKLELNRR